MSAATQHSWIYSSKRNPCPICGRTKDGDCRINSNGQQVICHHPKDLEPGDVVNGWAFTGNTGDGRADHFKPHEPLESDRRSRIVPLRTRNQQQLSPGSAVPAPITGPVELAQLPTPRDEPPDHLPHDTKLEYSSSQWVKVVVDASGKRHIPHHTAADGKQIGKAGPDPWPLWHEAEAIEHGRGRWIAEAEGEKCARWLQSGGLVAVTQPGHDHTRASIEARYRRLVEAKVSGIVYLADNDETGGTKADRCASAAAAAGLSFIAVYAADVWPEIPSGGSIDDAPGSAADRVATFVDHLQQWKPEQPAFIKRDDTTARWGPRKLSHGRAMARFDRCVEVQAIDNGPVQASQMASAWEMRIDHAKAGCCGDPLAEHDALWALLLERAREIISSSRRIAEQRQAIKAVAKSLGYNLTNTEINDLYDQLDTTLAAYEPDVEPGQEFSTFSQSWLLDEIFLVGLNLLVGMPGAGKSRLLVALIAAFLNGQDTFLQRRLLSGADRHVLIVGTDQDRQQWGALLAEQGLAKVIGTELVDGREKVTYRLHPRIHLKTSGGGFRLDADGMRWVRDWSQQHPGGMEVLDALSAVLPPGVKEADESAGRLMRQIEVARQGNPCIVTHHTNKQSAMNGELGVYSGSGSGSIDRAISRHIGLAYETHIGAGKEKLHTESPRRIITSQKRGAANQRFIVENGPFNTWDYISTAAEDRELKRQAQEGDAAERLKGWKKALYGVLTAAAGQWLTTSQVCDALPHEFATKPNASKQTQTNLRLLADDGTIEENRLTIGEHRWRVSQ